ncbi:MAG: PD-(D/E)XK nuclease-like domain-containing protein [Sulfurimonadaceae bacterium]
MSKMLKKEVMQIVEDMTNDAYHAEKEHLSSTKIKVLLENPYLFLNPPEREESPHFAIGSATHSLVLEPHKFEEEFAVAPECDRRTKAGKEAWAAFVDTSAGKTVIAEKDFETAKNMADAIITNQYAQTLLQNGIAECSFFSEIDGVKVKCRPDYYREDMGIIIDLKTTDNASPDGFAKTIANYGYYIQAAFYMDVLDALKKNARKFVFIAVEKKAPHMVGIYELDPISLEFGRSEYKRAFGILGQIGKYAEPTYKDITTGDVVQTLTLPNYVFYKKGA